MFDSMTSVLICVAAIWLTQRLLTIQQVVQVRKQLVQVGRSGHLSVGTAKKVGRRVYVGLAFDDRGVVNDALVVRGLTVFSRGRAQPALIGCTAVDLAAGRTPALPTLVAAACQESAKLLLAGRRASSRRAASAA